jgi:hypothetical protein
VSAHAKLIDHGKFLEDDWHILDELMKDWQVMACVIDPDPNIIEARRFARDFRGWVYLCRYRRGQVGKEINVADKESGSPILTVDRTNWISAALGRFKANRITLPRDISFEYREHLKNLVRTYVKDPDGNYVGTYLETGPDHYSHSLVYAEIALPLAASAKSGGDVGKLL